MPRRPRHEPGIVARAAVFVLLLGGGLTLLLFAARLVAAAFDSGFSPFGHLGLPGAYGWQGLLWATLAGASIVLLGLVVGPGRDEVWLAGAGGGVLVPAPALEGMLADEARTHADVVRVDVDVRVRKGRPSARLAVDLRPLSDGEAVAAELEAQTRASLARVTGVADVAVRVRGRVLTVKQLPGRLP